MKISSIESNPSIFSDRPVTYLYNTLHYYERKLRDRPSLKRRLVSAVLGSLREIRAPGWALSEDYKMYMSHSGDDAVAWVPELGYYIRLVQRIVESKTAKFLFNYFIILSKSFQRQYSFFTQFFLV